MVRNPVIWVIDSHPSQCGPLQNRHISPITGRRMLAEEGLPGWMLRDVVGDGLLTNKVLLPTLAFTHC